MCLESLTTKIPLMAKEDIVTYKLVVPKKRTKSIFLTIYREAKVLMGKTYTSILKKEKVYSWSNERGITEGLHSFCDIQSAQRLRNPEEKVAKCIIPKGSKYYKGVMGWASWESYASDTLKYVEIVNP